VSIGSTDPVSVVTNNTHREIRYIRQFPGAPDAGVPIPARILLISPIAEMQGGSGSTPATGPGTDNASRIRVVE